MRIRSALFVCSTVAVVASACGGGGTGGASTPAPTAPTAATVAATPGEPADADWELLGAQLATISMNALQTGLTTGVSTTVSPRLFELHSLNAPKSAVSYNMNYYCCGSTTTGSFISTAGQTTLADSRGFIVMGSTFASHDSSRWTSRDGRTSWGLRIPADGLRLTSTMATVGSAIRPEQEFRLAGSILFFTSTGVPVTGSIDVALAYTDFEKDSPRARGQIGTFRPTGQPMPLATNSTRCSQPREGCGPLVSGNFPCNGYPPCA